MRIGFDALAMQSPRHARRGIGRYAHQLITAMRAARGDHSFVLYAYQDLPTEALPDFPADAIRWIIPEFGRAGPTLAPALDRLVRINPDELDALLVLSPFESLSGYAPPTKDRQGPALAAILYDLIPLLFPDLYLSEPGSGAWLDYRLQTLRRYDVLLSISDATRADCLEKLGMPERRIATIGTAANGSFFAPDRTEPMPEETRGVLANLGINRPFVFSVAGFDPRKNYWKLIDAYASLPESLRKNHQLVVTFDLPEGLVTRVRQYASERGVGAELIVTGEVTDSALRVLYQRCSAFVFPSLYEGFGLPILEALHCGAAVVAGNNSAQPEAAGDAAVLVDTADPVAITDAMIRVLSNHDLARSLRLKAIDQAQRFSWERTAERALVALESASVTASSRRRSRPLRVRRRLAFFSTFPPICRAVPDSAQGLISELKRTYVVDRYHSEGFVPDPAWDADGSVSADSRLFERVAPYRDYHGIVYEVGDSTHHRPHSPLLMHYPGIATLHEPVLSQFLLDDGHAAVAEELAPGRLAHSATLIDRPDAHGDDPRRVNSACADHAACLSQRILENSRHVIVSSRWDAARILARWPELAGRVTVIPPGARARSVQSDHRRRIREKFRVSADAFLVAGFGSIRSDSMLGEILTVFESVARVFPSSVLVFDEAEANERSLRRRASAAGLEDRVSFAGPLSASDRSDLAAITDLGFSLCRFSSPDDSSAAWLDLMRHGVATIVTDHPRFEDLPSHVIRKVHTDAGGLDGLIQAALDLTGDPHARAVLGCAASEHVRRHHDWARVAEQYVEIIERCHTERSRSASSTGFNAHDPSRRRSLC